MKKVEFNVRGKRYILTKEKEGHKYFLRDKDTLDTFFHFDLIEFFPGKNDAHGWLQFNKDIARFWVSTKAEVKRIQKFIEED